MVASAIKKIGRFIWDTVVDWPAPNRREYETPFIPLCYRDARGTITYVGAFSPKEYELHKALKNLGDNVDPFSASIIKPNKKIRLTASGKFVNVNDLNDVGGHVTKSFEHKITALRNSTDPRKKGINIPFVSRVTAIDTYLPDLPMPQTPAELEKIEGLFLIETARPKQAVNQKLTPTKGEDWLHFVFLQISRVMSFGATLTTFAFAAEIMPIWVAVVFSGAFWYAVSTANIYDFWDKAENVIHHNWAVSKGFKFFENFSWKKAIVSILKLITIGVVAGMIGYGTYTGIAALPMIGSYALKVTLAVFSATIASLGAFHGFFNAVRALLGLSFSDMRITPAQINAAHFDLEAARIEQLSFDSPRQQLQAQVQQLQNQLNQNVVQLNQKDVQIQQLQHQLQQAQQQLQQIIQSPVYQQLQQAQQQLQQLNQQLQLVQQLIQQKDNELKQQKADLESALQNVDVSEERLQERNREIVELKATVAEKDKIIVEKSKPCSAKVAVTEAAKKLGLEIEITKAADVAVLAFNDATSAKQKEYIQKVLSGAGHKHDHDHHHENVNVLKVVATPTTTAPYEQDVNKGKEKEASKATSTKKQQPAAGMPTAANEVDASKSKETEKPVKKGNPVVNLFKHLAGKDKKKGTTVAGEAPQVRRNSPERLAKTAALEKQKQQQQQTGKKKKAGVK